MRDAMAEVVPPRPVFPSSEIDADINHAKANNARLEHIMTLLEALIYSIEGLREDIEHIANPPEGSHHG